MSKIKRIMLIVLATVMMLVPLACNTATKPVETDPPKTTEAVTTEPVETETPTSEPVATEPLDESIVITDHLGREVTIEEVPESLVSGYYITSSMLISLGLADKMVGLEAKAATRPIYSLAAPHLLDLPNTGSMKEFNLEGAIAMNADLYILPLRLEDAVNTLSDLGLTVIAVNPENMELLLETIAMIGLATGTEERAAKLISYYDDKVAELEAITAESEAVTVYLGGNSDYLSTATSQMYQNHLIELAGATNVAAEIDDSYWATISYEQLIDYNPDVIIIVPEAEYTKEDLLADDKLASISAIQNEEIYAMPDSFEAWDSPVPSAILGSMWLSSVLHEDAYPFEAFKDDVVDFYEVFYNFTAERDDITK